MKEPELEKYLGEAISKAEVGQKIQVPFSGTAVGPVKIMMRFAGGWEVNQTLIPGMPLEFTKGEDGYLKELSITILPNEGIKQQN